MDDPVSFNIGELYKVEGLTVVITGGGTGLGKGESALMWWASRRHGQGLDCPAPI